MSLRRIEMFILSALLLFMLLLLFGSLSAHAQSSLAVSAEGSFPSTTEAIYTRQDPFNQAGALVELRHIWNPLFGYEVAYSVNHANQRYTYVGPSTTGPAPQTVRAYNHEISADWVVSLPLSSFRPFALAGGGVQMFVPAGGQTGTQSDTKAVIVYGAGVDWEVLPHIGLRLQYRGNLYKAPDLAMGFPSTDQLVQSAQPSAGIFLSF